jgi:hypothetical protein
MLKLLADENFNNVILRGLADLNPSLDIVRVQDVGLDGADDLSVLDWAAAQDRVLVTHDLKTVPQFAAERIQQGLAMPGVVRVGPQLPIAKAIEDLEFLAVCGDPPDLENQIIHLPLT